MGGTLYVVGTPIGNLADLTERARAVLASVDLVACEDTRRTGRLLAHVGVEVPMRSFFAGNESERTDEILAALRGDRDVALVSDAGMPGISDPGFPLVRACVAAGIPIVAVPGASAVTAALVVSGFPMDRFVFEGFLPRSPARNAPRSSSNRRVASTRSSGRSSRSSAIGVSPCAANSRSCTRRCSAVARRRCSARSATAS